MTDVIPPQGDSNVCSVPGCVVSRATLAKWRQAAVETFLFPPALPLTLHSCPDWERDRWMAEIDLDPASRARSGKQTCYESIH